MAMQPPRPEGTLPSGLLAARRRRCGRRLFLPLSCGASTPTRRNERRRRGDGVLAWDAPVLLLARGGGGAGK